MAAELRARDLRDRTRAMSPLEPAKDAVIVDSTNMDEDEVIGKIGALVEEKIASNKL